MGIMQINRSIHSECDTNHIAISIMLTLTLNLTLTVNGPKGRSLIKYMKRFWIHLLQIFAVKLSVFKVRLRLLFVFVVVSACFDEVVSCLRPSVAETDTTSSKTCRDHNKHKQKSHLTLNTDNLQQKSTINVSKTSSYILLNTQHIMSDFGTNLSEFCECINCLSLCGIFFTS